MKRRVLRAHANKRCLRVLSASHLIHSTASAASASLPPSACTSASADRGGGYAILCDASFLRAVLLAYWQANAPAMWREARRRKLRKAEAALSSATASHNRASTTAGAASPQHAPSGAPAASVKQTPAKATAQGSAVTAASIARLPFGAMPVQSPHAFLTALLLDAFQDDGSPAAAAASSGAHAAGGATISSFQLQCLPATLVALHRMREAAHTVQAVSDVPGDDGSTRTPASAHPQAAETNAWLSASFGDSLAALAEAARDGGAGGRSAGSATAPLVFQEIPAAVVQHLLSKLTLIQAAGEAERAEKNPFASAQHGDENGGSDGQDQRQQRASAMPDSAAGGAELRKSTLKTASALTSAQRSEPRAVEAFIKAVEARLGRLTPAELSDGGACDVQALRLVPMPPFTSHAQATPRAVEENPHSAAAKRRRRDRNRRAAAAAAAAADGGSASAEAAEGPRRAAAVAAQSASSQAPRPFLLRTYFVATQSHDVRRRLPAATPLLRFTANPDAIWIEQRGAAYHYGTDDGPRSTTARAASVESSKLRRSGTAPPRHQTPHTSAGPTVMSAAPQLSRADVAFMKHLGKGSDLALPPKTPPAPSPSLAAPAASPQSPKSASGAATTGRKRRRREKGQNPLSMKKKHKRETFRAA